jgi:hypothetical protein
MLEAHTDCTADKSSIILVAALPGNLAGFMLQTYDRIDVQKSNQSFLIISLQNRASVGRPLVALLI